MPTFTPIIGQEKLSPKYILACSPGCQEPKSLALTSQHSALPRTHYRPARLQATMKPHSHPLCFSSCSPAPLQVALRPREFSSSCCSSSSMSSNNGKQLQQQQSACDRRRLTERQGGRQLSSRPQRRGSAKLSELPARYLK